MSDMHLTHLGACRTAFRVAPEACGRILLVGEDNPISDAPEHALYCGPVGCSGWRLQEKIFGLPRLQYLALWRTNLCVGGWSTKKARERARELTPPNTPWNLIILLGRKVASVFSQVVTGDSPPFHVRETNAGSRSSGGQGLFRFLSLPHPSGINARSYGAQAVADTRQIMRELAPDLAWGTV